MELFTLLGTIKIDYDEAVAAINNVKTKVESLASFISTDRLARGTLKIDTTEALLAIEAVRAAAQNLASFLGTNSAASGNIQVNNSTALSVINSVEAAVTNLATHINSGTNTIGNLRVDNTAALAAINEVETRATQVAGYLGDGSGVNASYGAYTGNAGYITGSTSSAGTATSDWILGSNMLPADTVGGGWRGLWTSIGNTAKKGFSFLDVAAGNLLASGLQTLGNKTLNFFSEGYDYNVNKEAEIAKYATLLQTSKEDAAEFFGEIEQFAIDTPLSLEQVGQSVTKLLGIGVQRDEIIPTMQMLGDLALGDTNAMARLAKAQTDVMGKTELLAQEGNQFTEVGVPIWRLLEQYYATDENSNFYGWSAGELRALDKNKLSIPYEDVLGALQMATSEGGMFYEALTTIMGTTQGKSEQMQDHYRRTAGAVTEMMTAVFTSDTIPAMNELLDKLDTWAEENPDTLYNLSEAFSNLATVSLSTFTESLKDLLDYWSRHRTEFDSLLVMLGAFAFPAHPAVGTALMAAGGLDLQKETADSMAEELRGASENRQFSFSSALMPDNVESKIVAGASRDDLTETEQEQYDKAVWWKTLMNLADGVWEKFAVWDDFEGNKKILESAWPNTQNETEEETEIYGPPTPEWFTPNNGALDGVGGNNGLIAQLAALTQQLSTLKADVMAGAQEGVANGFSGVTVTGSITTGDVRLNDGTLVGRLAPQLNLRLGLQDKFAARGSA